MATVARFEDLEIWQEARQMAFEIYELTMNGSFEKDKDLSWQIRRSSGSVMDNIAEGFERDGKNEFVQFLSIAKGSAGETRSQLYRAYDRKHLTEETFEIMLGKSINLIKKIARFINYLKTTSYKGSKFKN